MKNNTFSAPCTHDDSAGVGEDLAERLGLHFPDAYLSHKSMEQLSLAIRQDQGADFCVLPFCHTVEGEALGARINYGDARIGPRPGQRTCKTAEEILSLPPIDFTSGRISEVLNACASLAARGESVMLNMSGPLTILNVLMDTSDVFALLMKHSSEADQVFHKLSEELLRYAEAAADANVAVISYADPISAADIVGPKMAADIAGRFTVPFLSQLEPLLNRKKTVVILCPKTTRALEITGQLQCRPLDLSAAETLAQASKQASIVSGSCVKQLQRGSLSGRLTGFTFGSLPAEDNLPL